VPEAGLCLEESKMKMSTVTRPTRPVRHVAWLLLLLPLLLAGPLPLLAQPSAAPGAGNPQAVPVLQGSEVNEDRLVDALTPIQSRQIGIKRVPGAGGMGGLVRRPAASLLITFETNSSLLTAAARGQLDVVAAALKNEKLKAYGFGIEGHADPRGRADLNLALSQQRAESVRDYLVASHGIASERLRPVGKGATELANRRVPAAPENRRVTIATQVN
jgi:OmpA-OmpF porin, OOP family